MQIENSIANVQKGDPDSYGNVVREYQGRLRAFIASYCPDAGQVDEVAQETFVWAYEHLDQYRINTRFYAWLKGIARNLLLSELEKQKRETRMRKKYLDYIQAAQSRIDLLDNTVAKQADMAESLRKCLDELPEKSRAMIRIRYEEEKSVRSISEKTGKKEGSIKVMLFRIRQALRRCIEAGRPRVSNLPETI